MATQFPSSRLPPPPASSRLLLVVVVVCFGLLESMNGKRREEEEEEEKPLKSHWKLSLKTEQDARLIMTIGFHPQERRSVSFYLQPREEEWRKRPNGSPVPLIYSFGGGGGRGGCAIHASIYRRRRRRRKRRKKKKPTSPEGNRAKQEMHT